MDKEKGNSKDRSTKTLFLHFSNKNPIPTFFITAHGTRVSN
jgi:hypothetical protein